MMKKNLIGIVIVFMMLGVFIVGYELGKQSNTKAGKPGMGHTSRPGNASVRADSSQKTPDQPSGEERKKGNSSKNDQIVKNDLAEKKNMVEKKDMATKKEKKNKPVQNLPKNQASSGQVFYGTVIPYKEANVQGEQGASIIMLNYKEGDVVKKGDILVKLNDETKKLELIKAQSARKLSMQQVKQSDFNYTTELTKFKRSEGLYNDNLLSNQEFDIIKNNLQSAASSYEIAKENLIQAETQIKIIKNQLKDYVIKAPISGIIDRKNYNLGEVYRSGDVIYHLINMDQVYAEIKVPETYLKEIKKGLEVVVIFNALDNKSFPGTVETILATDASDSRNFTTKIKIKNPDQIIKMGMFAQIETGAGK